jgi:hypothetical protein
MQTNDKMSTAEKAYKNRVPEKKIGKDFYKISMPLGITPKECIEHLESFKIRIVKNIFEDIKKAFSAGEYTDENIKYKQIKGKILNETTYSLSNGLLFKLGMEPLKDENDCEDPTLYLNCKFKTNDGADYDVVYSVNTYNYDKVTIESIYLNVTTDDYTKNLNITNLNTDFEEYSNRTSSKDGIIRWEKNRDLFIVTNVEFTLVEERRIVSKITHCIDFEVVEVGYPEHVYVNEGNKELDAMLIKFISADEKSTRRVLINPHDATKLNWVIADTINDMYGTDGSCLVNTTDYPNFNLNDLFMTYCSAKAIKVKMD